MAVGHDGNQAGAGFLNLKCDSFRIQALRFRIQDPHRMPSVPAVTRDQARP